MSLEAQYEALDDLSAQPKASAMQPLIVGHNYPQIQQEMRDMQLARNTEVDLQEQLIIAQQQQISEQLNQQLADIHRDHPISAITGSPAASSSIDLSRELSGVITPPKTPGSSPIPDTPGVSPIPIQDALPKSPQLAASSPPKRPYVRATSRAASSVENQGETGVPNGKQVEANRRATLRFNKQIKFI